MFLAVDLPAPPLFQDTVEKNIIPQVSIYSVLAKYDGKSTQVRLPYIPLLSPLTRCPNQGVCGPAQALQMSEASAIHYSSLSKVH
jgi:hypothetical protein